MRLLPVVCCLVLLQGSTSLPNLAKLKAAKLDQQLLEGGITGGSLPKDKSVGHGNLKENDDPTKFVDTNNIKVYNNVVSSEKDYSDVSNGFPNSYKNKNHLRRKREAVTVRINGNITTYKYESTPARSRFYYVQKVQKLPEPKPVPGPEAKLLIKQEIVHKHEISHEEHHTEEIHEEEIHISHNQLGAKKNKTKKKRKFEEETEISIKNHEIANEAKLVAEEINLLNSSLSMTSQLIKETETIEEKKDLSTQTEIQDGKLSSLEIVNKTQNSFENSKNESSSAQVLSPNEAVLGQNFIELSKEVKKSEKHETFEQQTISDTAIKNIIPKIDTDPAMNGEKEQQNFNNIALNKTISNIENSETSTMEKNEKEEKLNFSDIVANIKSEYSTTEKKEIKESKEAAAELELLSSLNTKDVEQKESLVNEKNKTLAILDDPAITLAPIINNPIVIEPLPLPFDPQVFPNVTSGSSIEIPMGPALTEQESNLASKPSILNEIPEILKPTIPEPIFPTAVANEFPQVPQPIIPGPILPTDPVSISDQPSPILLTKEGPTPITMETPTTLPQELPSVIPQPLPKLVEPIPSKESVQNPPTTIAKEFPQVPQPIIPGPILPTDPVSISEQPSPILLTKEVPAPTTKETPTTLPQELPSAIPQTPPKLDEPIPSIESVQNTPTTIANEFPQPIIPGPILPTDPVSISEQPSPMLTKEFPTPIIKETPTVLPQQLPSVIPQPLPKLVEPIPSIESIQNPPTTIANEFPQVPQPTISVPGFPAGIPNKVPSNLGEQPEVVPKSPFFAVTNEKQTDVQYSTSEQVTDKSEFVQAYNPNLIPQKDNTKQIPVNNVGQPTTMVTGDRTEYSQESKISHLINSSSVVETEETATYHKDPRPKKIKAKSSNGQFTHTQALHTTDIHLQTDIHEFLDIVTLEEESEKVSYGIPIVNGAGVMEYLSVGSEEGDINFVSSVDSEGHTEYLYPTVDDSGQKHNIHLKTTEGHLSLVEVDYYNGLKSTGFLGYDATGTYVVPVHFEEGHHLVAESRVHSLQYAIDVHPANDIVTIDQVPTNFVIEPPPATIVRTTPTALKEYPEYVSYSLPGHFATDDPQFLHSYNNPGVVEKLMIEQLPPANIAQFPTVERYGQAYQANLLAEESKTSEFAHSSSVLRDEAALTHFGVPHQKRTVVRNIESSNIEADNSVVIHLQTGSNDFLDIVSLGEESGVVSKGIPIINGAGKIEYLSIGNEEGDVHFVTSVNEGHTEYLYPTVDDFGQKHNIHLKTTEGHLSLVEVDFENGLHSTGFLGYDDTGTFIVPVHYEEGHHLVAESTVHSLQYAVDVHPAYEIITNVEYFKK